MSTQKLWLQAEIFLTGLAVTPGACWWTTDQMNNWTKTWWRWPTCSQTLPCLLWLVCPVASRHLWGSGYLVMSDWARTLWSPRSDWCPTLQETKLPGGNFLLTLPFIFFTDITRILSSQLWSTPQTSPSSQLLIQTDLKNLVRDLAVEPDTDGVDSMQTTWSWQNHSQHLRRKKSLRMMHSSILIVAGKSKADQIDCNIIWPPGRQRRPPWWAGLLRTSSWRVSFYRTDLSELLFLIISKTVKATSREPTPKELKQMELQMKTCSDTLQQISLDTTRNILPETFLVTTRQKVVLKTDIECLRDTGKKLSVSFILFFELKKCFCRKDYSGSLPDFSYLFTNTIELSFGKINLLDWVPHINILILGISCCKFPVRFALIREWENIKVTLFWMLMFN